MQTNQILHKSGQNLYTQLSNRVNETNRSTKNQQKWNKVRIFEEEIESSHFGNDGEYATGFIPF